jgi:hypothetical protein
MVHHGTISGLLRSQTAPHALSMRIADTALDEFIEIYKEEFGESISRSDARQMASSLIALYERLARKLLDDSTLPLMQPTDDHPSVGFRT